MIIYIIKTLSTGTTHYIPRCTECKINIVPGTTKKSAEILGDLHLKEKHLGYPTTSPNFEL
jgi:hypothetical protein